ncbi:hypothetical protein NDU88_003974 [Pleurodeles waltl]|uniref:Uncharacterized protein n=1 Tax=Pleurodeles waltl TaxID=8319 RepID=A0AAV7QDJ1_PLEWA|nr:hypothetical protein NDU88_003974 [Pleurodeles waltl]
MPGAVRARCRLLTALPGGELIDHLAALHGDYKQNQIRAPQTPNGEGQGPQTGAAPLGMLQEEKSGLEPGTKS